MFEKPDYVMVNVSNMDRSVAFYRDVLGLKLKFASPQWTEFDSGTTTLALHGTSTAAVAPAGRGEPAAGTCTFGFSVSDLDATHADLSRRGVRFVMPPTDRPGEGIRLAVAIDPDGLPISFAQSAK